MLTLYNYEGKTKEEAFNKCFNQLKLLEEDLYISEKEEEGKLFKSKKVIIEVLKKEDLIDYIKKFIKDLGQKMNISINSEVREKDGIINVLLVSDNNSILIGKDGRTLESIQLLLKQAINQNANVKLKLSVDVSNYKVKKSKNLEFEIKKICKEIEKTKVEVKLDPMNSYDRRIVHTIVSEFPNLNSESFGEGKERRTVISYKES